MARTTGAILMASGRVPKTLRIRMNPIVRGWRRAIVAALEGMDIAGPRDWQVYWQFFHRIQGDVVYLVRSE
jgi:hypothetical protein